MTAMDFVEFGRYYIEAAAGGNGSWTAGVDFARQLAVSPYAQEVKALYRKAGLSLRDDLRTLASHAHITADSSALRWLRDTSVPTGRLQVPELDFHTISDQLIPVQQEHYYRETVQLAGRSELLRQAYVQRQLHCNFTPPELVAGVLAVQHRLDAGGWGTVTDASSLEAAANSLNLGMAAFIRYRPASLTGTNGSRP
jgi:hypothetical protein